MAAGAEGLAQRFLALEMSARILVVEDDEIKLRRIVSALTAVHGIQKSDIHVALDANSAKKLMREAAFDLVVLDIALPRTQGEIPTPDGGIGLLQEVLERDVYRRPREVVGLTAFPEVRDSAGPQFAEDLWQIIQYDSASNTWAEQLQRKVRHILIAKAVPEGIPSHDIHLGIITALPSPELSAVLSLPWHWKPVDQHADGTVYHRGHFERGSQQYSVIAASAARMGLAPAAALSMKMIHRFKPRYLAMAGIAAGLKDECSLGDIILADPAWDWGSGKMAIDNGKPVFEQAPHQLGISSFIRGKATLLANDEVQLDGIRRGWPGLKPNFSPKLLIRPLASGASVLANSAFVEELKSQHRKLTGIDMETYGVYSAADEAPLPQPKAFSLKAVCDFADAAKNDEYQAYAAYVSATALQVFVERYL